ncbi:MAG: cell division protein FtsQ/DivIB, partial [Jiangellaceae bacterium]
VLGAGVAVLVAAAVAGAAWLVGWSDLMALEAVRVEGATGSLADEVSAAADAPVGTPLVRIDTDAVGSRVGALAEIADVSVGRSWPRSLVVTVTPRVAAAAVPDDGSWWSVDGSGVLFELVDERPEGLPVLSAPVDEDAAVVRAAGVTVLTGLPPAVGDLVETVTAESEADVRLELADGATVLWGGAQDVERKAQVLIALIAQQVADVYDLSAPERPAVRR